MKNQEDIVVLKQTKDWIISEYPFSTHISDAIDHAIEVLEGQKEDSTEIAHTDEGSQSAEKDIISNIESEKPTMSSDRLFRIFNFTLFQCIYSICLVIALIDENMSALYGWACCIILLFVNHVRYSPEK